MHEIEPYHNWLKYYDPATDDRSPFYGKEYNYDVYSETIYGYYIDPAWDYMGSETLYVKVLYTDYEARYTVIEFIGEWNDAINNDIMHLKRNVIELLLNEGINKFILIGENIMNFHGSDDCYYEEWFQDVEDGWIAGVNFREHVIDEFKSNNIDYYINFGGELDDISWRSLKPIQFFKKVEEQFTKRLT